MSGSGGPGNTDWRPTDDIPERGDRSGGGERGGGGSAPSDPCIFTETSTLNSPKKNVVVTLRVGDVLDVNLLAGPPRQLVAQHNGAIAGSITSPKSPQIIQCIQQRNVTYVAEVTAVRGGVCQIEIRPK